MSFPAFNTAVRGSVTPVCSCFERYIRAMARDDTNDKC